MNLSVPTVEEVAKDDNLNFKVFAFEEVPKVYVIQTTDIWLVLLCPFRNLLILFL